MVFPLEQGKIFTKFSHVTFCIFIALIPSEGLSEFLNPSFVSFLLYFCFYINVLGVAVVGAFIILTISIKCTKCRQRNILGNPIRNTYIVALKLLIVNLKKLCNKYFTLYYRVAI